MLFSLTFFALCLELVSLAPVSHKNSPPLSPSHPTKWTVGLDQQHASPSRSKPSEKSNHDVAPAEWLRHPYTPEAYSQQASNTGTAIHQQQYTPRSGRSPSPPHPFYPDRRQSRKGKAPMTVIDYSKDQEVTSFHRALPVARQQQHQLTAPRFYEKGGASSRKRKQLSPVVPSDESAHHSSPVVPYNTGYNHFYKHLVDNKKIPDHFQRHNLYGRLHESTKSQLRKLHRVNDIEGIKKLADKFADNKQVSVIVIILQL
jgi:hypothetical protein